MLSAILKRTQAHQTAASASSGLWQLAWRRLKRDRIAMLSLWIVGFYFLLLILSLSGLLAKDWDQEVAVSYAPPTFMKSTPAVEVSFPEESQLRAASGKPVEPLQNNGTALNLQVATVQGAGQIIEDYGVVDPLAEDMLAIEQELGGQLIDQRNELKQSLIFGADKWGQDILLKTIKGAETSILVGLIAAVMSVAIGTLLGAVAGYFGGWVDDALNWFYNIFTSIPYLLLILAIAAVLQQKGILAIILILGLTGWTGVFRLVRAEYMKHTSREYVLAAKAIGVSHMRRMFVHIFPNVSHIALVQMSILVVAFIKSEVILSFLGFGVPTGVVSWGSMLNEAQSELILGKWWQLAAASIAMAVLVTAFSMFSDALRDALDPKLK